MVRNAKEYLGESLLIIFSVVLALLLTELFNKLHENSREKEILSKLRQELVNNKKAEEIQYQYQLQVLKNIDSALLHPEYAKQFIDNGVINLKAIAPDGVLRLGQHLGRTGRADEGAHKAQQCSEGRTMAARAHVHMFHQNSIRPRSSIIRTLLFR